MIPQPVGWLRRASEIARGHGALLMADQVMTGLGRAGCKEEIIPAKAAKQPLLACHHEGVQPDFAALAKGLTGGYLPMAATLTTRQVFDAFLGDYAEFKTFFHGHSYTGNQLGAAASLASLDMLQTTASIRARQNLQRSLQREIKALWAHPHVGDIREVGLIVGIELVKNWRTREAFDLRQQVGIRVCEAMARRGVLTRPIGNVIVLMPPYSTTTQQARTMVTAVGSAIREVFKGEPAF